MIIVSHIAEKEALKALNIHWIDSPLSRLNHFSGYEFQSIHTGPSVLWMWDTRFFQFGLSFGMLSGGPAHKQTPLAQLLNNLGIYSWVVFEIQ